MKKSGLRLSGVILLPSVLAALAFAEEPGRALDTSQFPPPKVGKPEDYAKPVIERPVFDRIRWNMSMEEIQKEYEDRTFWFPQSTVYTKCVKWQEPIMDQMHFINVCGDDAGYPVSITVTSEDTLSREWIQIVGERYDVAVPYETKGFKEGRTIEFPPFPTQFRMAYENFEDSGQRRQRMTLVFVNQLRNEKLQKSKAEPAVASPPVKTPIEKAKAEGK